MATNNFIVKIFNLILQSECWAQFNILLNIEGIEINDDILLLLINFLAVDSAYNLNLLKIGGNEEFLESDFIIFKNNTLNIITEICEDKDINISNIVVDTIVKRIIFSSKKAFKFINIQQDLKDQKIKSIKERLFKALAIKNLNQTKASYEKYIMYKKYSVK